MYLRLQSEQNTPGGEQAPGAKMILITRRM